MLMQVNTLNTLLGVRLCDGATYQATGVKDPWNGGIFGTYRLTGLRIRSYVPTQTSVQILGTQGDTFIVRRTRKQFF